MVRIARVGSSRRIGLPHERGLGEHRSHPAFGWDFHLPTYEDKEALEPYSLEDRLFDELEQLPTPQLVGMLIRLMKPIELRELSEGVLNDCIQATHQQSLLDVANALNSWIATAEETVASRRKYRHIRAARERSDPRESGMG